MARKEDPQAEMEALIERMHGSGDARILINYLTAYRDEVKHRSYDEKVIISPYLSSNINGQQLSYDNILETISNVLSK